VSHRISVITVADLHRREDLYADLELAVNLHRPDMVAFVGDLLHAFDDNEGRHTTAECAKRIASLDCEEMVFVRGNHEDQAWWEFQSAWEGTGKALHALDRKAFASGPMVMLGFPCRLGDQTAFVESASPGQNDQKEGQGWETWLRPVLRQYGPASRTLWLMHEPPNGTLLSQKVGPAAGCPKWREAIEEYSPLLVITGHDHFTPQSNKCWHDTINSSRVVNVGQPSSGPLHYTLIEAEFPSDARSLPTSLQVTAFPSGEVLKVR
jgi:Icc-related predicted phosphoesterase